MTQPKDFETRTHYVYEFYAEDGTCLYVGSTWRIGGRIRQHGSKPWWPQVARIEINKYPDHETGRSAEAERTKLLTPTYDGSLGLGVPRRSRREELHREGGVCNYGSKCARCNNMRKSYRPTEWWTVTAEELATMYSEVRPGLSSPLEIKRRRG